MNLSEFPQKVIPKLGFDFLKLKTINLVLFVCLGREEKISMRKSTSCHYLKRDTEVLLETRGF